ncbi:hypothetical protein NKR19_g2148 [Coniochaeta hoffmannii]|uniref:Inosine/uridine-preferring nucleoside hydrolase domain-containing protein n=1 Tax=Coniochaeta hoffmannii TaxID=91930 RepID=A0AA38RZB0_9PEZI|nr:hypothetical protein NKR19_g2148 [Coniochaeta hoffmannii]
MIPVIYGSMPWKSCLNNVGFEALRKYTRLVAVGPEHSLEEEILREDGFQDVDGRHGVHETELLHILGEEPEDTTTIRAVGPMTNLALAAAEDPATFLHANKICVMAVPLRCRET